MESLMSGLPDRPVILAVDDDPGIVSSLMAILKDHYLIKPFTSGLQALKFLERFSADLILLDYYMPLLSGGDLFDLLRANARTEKIPVIFLTGNQQDETEVEVLQKGAMDYIQKPVKAQTLLARVRLQLELKGYRHHLEQLVENKTKDLVAAYNKLKLREEITLGLLARVTDMRDHDTGDHITRTTEFTKLIVNELLADSSPGYQLSDLEAENIIQSVKLHDIGKIAIPDHILQKPAPLKPEEFAVVKMHPEHGSRLLDEFIERMGDDSFLNTARDIVLRHHEKWDGTGYPGALVQESIPLSARITALADVYDALTSSRPYKAPFSHEKSKEIIINSAGKHFDPHLVSVFLRVESAFKRIAQAL